MYTREDSLGSPIINIKNEKIDIHKGGKEFIKCNRGTFLNYPIKDFREKNKNKNKNNNINIINKSDSKNEKVFIDLNTIPEVNSFINKNNQRFNYFTQNNNDLYLIESNKQKYITYTHQENNTLNINDNNYFLCKGIRSNNNVNEYYKESRGGILKNYAYIKGPNSQEDNCIAIENFKNDKNKMIFGLFDSHGGGQVSKFLQEKLVLNFKRKF